MKNQNVYRIEKYKEYLAHIEIKLRMIKTEYSRLFYEIQIVQKGIRLWRQSNKGQTVAALLI